MRYPKTEPQKVTRRQDRKPKVFCPTCGKSQRMEFTRFGRFCPKCMNHLAYPKRTTAGCVDYSKPERGQ